MSASPDYKTLVSLLEERLSTIADTAWRDRDPDGQLAALGDVSTRIDEWKIEFGGAVSPQMAHFLVSNCHSSFRTEQFTSHNGGVKGCYHPSSS